jgi:hypothetical protein
LRVSQESCSMSRHQRSRSLAAKRHTRRSRFRDQSVLIDQKLHCHPARARPCRLTRSGFRFAQGREAGRPCCLHTSLVELAHAVGHAADNVNYLGLGGLKDCKLMGTIRQQDYTFVTNNRSDFLALHGREPLRAGVIIIVPSVTPVCQRELFSATLKHINGNDPP